MKETSKCQEQRMKNGTFEKYLNGYGIDIGCSNDPLVVLDGEVVPYDIKFMKTDGELNEYEDDTFDFVYSSHCLEHQNDITKALNNWIRICKPNGYIYIVVPDETLYEKNKWPSMFAKAQHKWSFTIEEPSSLPKNIAIKSFLEDFEEVELVDIFLNDSKYDYKADWRKDQTRGNACCHIEFILKKRLR
jgi:SAM-dependent methyltransferase